MGTTREEYGTLCRKNCIQSMNQNNVPTVLLKVKPARPLSEENKVFSSQNGPESTSEGNLEYTNNTISQTSMPLDGDLSSAKYNSRSRLSSSIADNCNTLLTSGMPHLPVMHLESDLKKRVVKNNHHGLSNSAEAANSIDVKSSAIISSDITLPKIVRAENLCNNTGSEITENIDIKVKATESCIDLGFVNNVPVLENQSGRKKIVGKNHDCSYIERDNDKYNDTYRGSFFDIKKNSYLTCAKKEKEHPFVPKISQISPRRRKLQELASTGGVFPLTTASEKTLQLLSSPNYHRENESTRVNKDITYGEFSKGKIAGPQQQQQATSIIDCMLNAGDNKLCTYSLKESGELTARERKQLQDESRIFDLATDSMNHKNYITSRSNPRICAKLDNERREIARKKNSMYSDLLGRETSTRSDTDSVFEKFRIKDSSNNNSILQERLMMEEMSNSSTSLSRNQINGNHDVVILSFV